MRILGARDGYLGALLKVRDQMAYIRAEPIHPHHTKRLAERERRLRPLKALERMFDEQQRECNAAYIKRTQLETV